MASSARGLVYFGRPNSTDYYALQPTPSRDPSPRRHYSTTCRIGLLALLGVGALQVAAQGIYKWTDSQGQVHFGDRPQGINAAPVTVNRGSPPTTDNDATSRTARTARTARLLDEYATERAEQAESNAKAQAELAEHRKQCAEVRARLADIDNSHYLYTRDADGTKHVLSDAEHAAARTAVLKEMAQVCRGAPLPPRKR